MLEAHPPAHISAVVCGFSQLAMRAVSTAGLGGTPERSAPGPCPRLATCGRRPRPLSAPLVRVEYGLAELSTQSLFMRYD